MPGQGDQLRAKNIQFVLGSSHLNKYNSLASLVSFWSSSLDLQIGYISLFQSGSRLMVSLEQFAFVSNSSLNHRMCETYVLRCLPVPLD